VAKIPEVKYCAVRVTPGGVPPAQGSYGGGQAPVHRGEP
jgi:formate dehydrogenase major subunit